ncbi:MAG: hypothetical protein ACLQLC_07880 [Candidatus Sulfotelmatobacter sp.]
MTRAREIADELKTLPAQTSLEVMPGLTLRKTANGVNVARLHYSAHPDRHPQLRPEWRISERKAYPSQAAWDREQEIVDEAGGGERVFADVLLTYWNKIVIEGQDEITDIVERSREWEVGGGFDHGKTNPTCLLRAYVDFDGTIIYAGEYYMPGREIWQHAPLMQRMYDFDRMEAGSLGIQSDRSIFPLTQQQEQRPGHAPERAKSYADLYRDQGVANLVPFGGGDASDVSFALRLHSHWSDLEHRAPSVRIICPRGLYVDKPQPGLYNWGCPNLLWELMVARRTKLTAQQLLCRNTSEAIVDKDNHARDAMKYFLMMQPEPSRKPRGQRVSERIQATLEEAKRKGVDPDQAMTSTVFQYGRIMREEQEEDTPTITYYGGKARHRIVEMQREIDRRYGGGGR